MQALSVFVVLALPLSVFMLQAVMGQLGPDPAKVTMLNLGHAAISILLLVLSLPLLAKLPGLRFIKRYSRMVGLWAFSYVSLHFLSYLAVMTGFQWQILLQDLTQRPYAYVGFAAWLMLLLLALTSSKYAQRLLKRRWKLLHRLVYLAVIAALVHILWVARSDIIWFLTYAAVFILLCLLKTPALSLRR